MNTRTIVKVVATALLSGSLASLSLAQDDISSAQGGIEVITIIGKRPASAVAAACVNRIGTSVDNAAGLKNDVGNLDKEVPQETQPAIGGSDHATKRCNEQTATVEAQI